MFAMFCAVSFSSRLDRSRYRSSASLIGVEICMHSPFRAFCRCPWAEIGFRCSFLQKTGHRSPLQIRESSEISCLLSKLDLVLADLGSAFGQDPCALEHVLKLTHVA